MADIYGQLTGQGLWCTGIQGIYAQLLGGPTDFGIAIDICAV